MNIELSLEHLVDHLESAWGVIANAMESMQNEDWLEAAKRWRDEYHSILHAYCDQTKLPDVSKPRYHCNHCGLDFNERASAPYGELGCPACYSDDLLSL